MLTLRYLARFDKPFVFLNQRGFYDDLLRFFDAHAARNAFAAWRGCMRSRATVDEIWPHLENPAAYQAEQLWR